MRENISVLIPWRGGDPQRERVWDFVRAEWEKTGVELCVGVDDPGGPFNCSRALNRAFRMSTKPIIMQFGADCLPSTVAVDLAYTLLVHDFQLNWIPLFDRTDYYNEYATESLLRGIPENTLSTDENLAVPFQTGVLAMTREAFLETGGSDERFEGWGAEDSAFRMCLWRLYGGGTPLPFTLRCLWHNNEHRVLGEENLSLCQEYERIDNREDMLQYIEQRGRYV